MSPALRLQPQCDVGSVWGLQGASASTCWQMWDGLHVWYDPSLSLRTHYSITSFKYCFRCLSVVPRTIPHSLIIRMRRCASALINNTRSVGRKSYAFDEGLLPYNPAMPMKQSGIAYKYTISRSSTTDNHGKPTADRSCFAMKMVSATIFRLGDVRTDITTV